MILKRVLLFIVPFFLFSCGSDNSELTELDRELKNIIETLGLSPLEKKEVSDAKFKLGQALFFDKIVSGNKDIACATCHHPRFGTSDCLQLSVGTKGIDLCTDREKAEGREFAPRNSPDIFTKGLNQWHTMFWDGRIEERNGKIITPAGDQTPEGLESVLAAQSLFPPTSRTEMRGNAGDFASDGSINEIAQIPDGNFTEIWNAIMNRILSIDEYVEMFKRAYPGKTEFTIVDFANAIAAFETEAFMFTNTPWDEYLKGNTDALTEEAKRGALLFYGKAGCYKCHSGSLFTDQKYHNLAVPQFGPGKAENGLDYGRFHVTGNPEDKYKFRTPHLRNLMVTAPYFHNGAYDSLEKVIKHHINPEESLRNYNPYENGLSEELIRTLKNDEETIQDILSTVDIDIPQLTDEEIDYLIAFLMSLTSPELYDEDRIDRIVPSRVPSGLPVDRVD